jgi:polyphosphate kinase 2 (PPK2 family)
MLEQVDLTLSLDRQTYIVELTRCQLQLRELGRQVYVQKRPVVILFEGWDAAGKGGAIKRVTERLDPRGYVVYPIGAPQGDDKTRHYLFRFWRRLPERGQIAVFDRSWYGRVLVERVEGFCAEAEWKRAYREINSFERELVQYGTLLFKFWIHISREEQLRRFEEREGSEYKSWKLTDEDWRNRLKWDQYEEAINEMLLKTSTLTAPWTLVEGNDKWWARVRVLKTLVEGLAKGLDYRPHDPIEHESDDEESPPQAGKRNKKNKHKS